MFQLQFNFSPEVPLNPNIILRNDPRWQDALALWKSSRAFGYDIETYGHGKNKKSEAVDPMKAEIRLVQVGLENGDMLVADFGGWESDKKRAMKDNWDFLEILREKGPSSAVKIGHNISFDMILTLRHFGVPFRNIRDTMLMSMVYWAGVKDYHHTLKDVGLRLGYQIDKEEQMSSWGQELSNNQLNYAGYDVQVVLKIAKDLKRMLIADKLWDTAMIENNACPAFVEMMFCGLPINLEKLESILTDYERVANDAVQEFKRTFPGVSPTSNPQIVKAVNAKYSVERPKTWVNIDAANKEVLAFLKEPWVEGLLLYRGLNTQIAYLKNIQRSTVNGRAHPKFFQLAGLEDRKEKSDKQEGAGMGRSSCKEPNMQNPSTPTKKWLSLGLRSVREIFDAPPGYKYIINDLSQAHMRIAAEASQDPVLVEAYNSNLCLHSMTAAQLAIAQGLDPSIWTHENIKKWDKDETNPNHEKAKSLRKVGKTQNYSALNGAGPETVMKRSASNSKDPVFAPIEDWIAVGKAFKELYSGLETYRRQRYNEANTHDIVFGHKHYGWIYGHSGRRIFLEKLPTTTYDKSGHIQNKMMTKYTDTCSHVWMSTEADIAKTALYSWQNERDQHGWDAELINFPHDELNLLAREDCAYEAAAALLRIMDDAMRKYIHTIPVNDTIRVETLICQSWSEK